MPEVALLHRAANRVADIALRAWLLAASQATVGLTILPYQARSLQVTGLGRLTMSAFQAFGIAVPWSKVGSLLFLLGLSSALLESSSCPDRLVLSVLASIVRLFASGWMYFFWHVKDFLKLQISCIALWQGGTDLPGPVLPIFRRSNLGKALQ